MKCLNMNVGGMLIILANFVAMYSSGFQQDKTSSQTMTLKGEDNFKSKLNKDCPRLLEVVSFVSKKYNLIDYGVNCEELTSEVLSEGTVLQYVCFVVQSFLYFICDNKLNMTINSLKQDNASFCPFQLAQFGITFQRSDLVEQLTRSDNCRMVCYDFNNPKPQCIILSLFNNYLKSSSEPLKERVPSQVEDSQIKPDEMEVTVQKTENLAPSKKIEQQEEKNETVKPKTETISNKVIEAAVVTPKAVKLDNKTEKPETVVSTPPKEQTSESEVKSLGNDNFLSENIDDDLGLIYSVPLGEAPVTNSPKMESFEDKNFVSSSKIYSGDDFFQAEDSHFFFYFIMVSSIIVVGYLAFHNKNKILAYALEGTSGRRRGRRPNPARYRKLETNLEEVISSSSTNMAASSVVY